MVSPSWGTGCVVAVAGLADELRDSARTNAARFPLTATAFALATLSDSLS